MITKDYEDMNASEQLEWDLRRYNDLGNIMYSLATKDHDSPANLLRIECGLTDGFSTSKLSSDLMLEVEILLRMGELHLRNELHDIVAKERTRIRRRLVEKGIDYL